MSFRSYLVMRFALLSRLILPFALFVRLPAAELFVADATQLTWGRIIPAASSTGTIQLEVRTWPADGKLPLPTPFPNITAAHLLDGLKREPLKWEFNNDATRLHLELPAQAPSALPRPHSIHRQAPYKD